ncbi:MAG: GTP 3',8-cyclase MoaA [Oscillospiraceae bacterium]
MRDKFGRDIHYLRLSVTERCQLFCEYCRDMQACEQQYELSLDEIELAVQAAAELGTDKVRLTGGEPLMRGDIVRIAQAVSAVDGITEVVMTTNGLKLCGMVEPLKNAGISRFNISIDSLRADRYREITRGGELSRVLDAIDEVRNSGVKLKLNVVLMRGTNDDEIDDFIALTENNALSVRFIELMPIGKAGEYDKRRICSDEILELRPQLTAVKNDGVAVEYAISGYAGTVGFISPLSHRFCKQCNRFRITSDGMLRTCLGNGREISLIDALHHGREELKSVMRAEILDKPEEHCFESGLCSGRTMNKIGG